MNQVNLRDCCSVNQDLVDFAKKEELELLTHSDCSSELCCLLDLFYADI